MKKEVAPENPPTGESPVFVGLWEALVRTLESSGDSEFSPNQTDMGLFEAAICLPVAKRFAKSNQESLEEYLQDTRIGLSQVFRIAVTHPALGAAPLENRDREAANYLRCCLRNELLVIAEKNPISREMRTRVREALRIKNPPVEEGVEGERRFIEGNFGFEMAGAPATAKATQTNVDDLEKSLPGQKAAGFSGDVLCGLPTAEQIAGLLTRVAEETGLGFSEDQLRALAHKVFSVPGSLSNVSLDEPPGEDEEAREFSASDLHPDAPEHEEAGAIAVPPEIASAKREMFALIASREARTHQKSGNMVRDAFLYLMLRNGELLEGGEKITATLYEERTGISDATTLERLQYLRDDFRRSKVLQDLGRDVLRAAIADIQKESEENFRKFWGLRSSSET